MIDQPINQPAPIFALHDLVARFGQIVFVLNLAHQFFQHILQRDQPRDLAVLVDHNRHVDAFAPEGRKQIVNVLELRDKEGRARQIPEISVFIDRAHAEQVFGIEDAGDVIKRILVERQARVARTQEQFDGLFQ